MKKIVIVLLLAALIFTFAACSENEPGAQLNPKAEALPDASFSNNSWPADALPEILPVPKYESLNLVERKNNEVIIQMFGSVNDVINYENILFDLGFATGDPKNLEMYTSITPLVNKDGWQVAIYDNGHLSGLPAPHLQGIDSPTGYVWEIRVKMIIPDHSLFTTWPDPNESLDLEEKVFNEWPTSYLPKGFPKPDKSIKIISMEQKANGVFIKMSANGSIDVFTKYWNRLIDAGYSDGKAPYVNENNDRFYITGNPETGAFVLHVIKAD